MNRMIMVCVGVILCLGGLTARGGGEGRPTECVADHGGRHRLRVF